MAEQVSITPQVLTGAINNILSVLMGTYNSIAAATQDKADKVPALPRLGQALQLIQAKANDVLAGNVKLTDWAGWVRQAENALVLCAGQAKAAGADANLVASANAAKSASEKTLNSLGLSTPPILLLGAAAIGLGLVGLWAYKEVKSGRKTSLFGADDEEDEGEEQELDELEADSSDDDENDADDADDDTGEDPPPRQRRKRLRWSSLEGR